MPKKNGRKKDSADRGQLHLRIPAEILAEITESARANRRKINDECIVWFENSSMRKSLSNKG